ncbi:MAG: hypothetical protein K2W93_09790 [Burkholderiaceae bacterium]|nr:hypothetical protein [Burkholderiaceae bacterium]
MNAELITLIGLGVPALGFLARISTQLGHLTAGHEHHAGQLANHETRITKLEQL